MNTENIILGALHELYAELTDILYGTEAKWKTLDELIEAVESAVTGFVRTLVEQYIGEVQELFFQGGKKLRPNLKVKERHRRKSVLTKIGLLELPQDLYTDRETGKTAAPVLQKLGIKPHQKVTDAVIGSCLEAVTGLTYAKVAELVTEGELTRQTISNYVKNSTDTALFEVPVQKRQVKILNVYMDEDHIALQHAGRKKHAIVPFAVVAEGVQKENEGCELGRNRLINPRYFVSRDLRAKSVAVETAGYIAAEYDLKFVEHIYVHGDAGSWIRKALEDEIGAEHVLDGFHLTREITRFARRFPQDCRTILRTLKAALKNDDFAAFDAEAAAREASAPDESCKKKCRAFRTFFKNNWKPAVLRQDKTIIGSCTESQVQHLCSCRISSVPMSWSLRGVGSLMMLRAAQANGVNIARPKKEEQQTGGYARLLEEERRSGIGGKHDWSIFEHEHMTPNQDSGTQHLLKLIGQGGFRPCA